MGRTPNTGPDSTPNAKTGPEDGAKPARLKGSAKSVLAALIRIAEDENTKPKEKVAALDSIARLQGLIVKRSETTLKVAPNVMLVPFVDSLEKWEAIAKPAQAKLAKEASTGEPAPTPETQTQTPPHP